MWEMWPAWEYGGVVRGWSKTPLTRWMMLSKDNAGRRYLNEDWNMSASQPPVPHNQPLLSRRINHPQQSVGQRNCQTVKCKLFIGFISYSLCVLISQAASLAALRVLPIQSWSSGVGEWQKYIQLFSLDCWIVILLLANSTSINLGRATRF